MFLRISHSEQTPGFNNEAQVLPGTLETAGFLKDKQAALEYVENNFHCFSESEKLIVLGRLFQHSLEDGLKMSEKLGVTKNELQVILQNPKVYFKHQKFLSKLLKDSLNGATGSDKDRIEELQVRFKQMDESLIQGQTEQFLKAEPSYKDVRLKQFIDRLDAIYAQLLTTKKLAPEASPEPRSRGEKQGEAALEKIKLSLEKNYYPEDIFNLIFKKIAETDKNLVEQQARVYFEQSRVKAKYPNRGFTAYYENLIAGKESSREVILQILQCKLSAEDYERIVWASFVSEADKSRLFAVFGVDDAKVLKKAEEARYQPLDILFRAEASAAQEKLVQEINSQAQVIYDEKAGEYKVEVNKKSPEEERVEFVNYFIGRHQNETSPFSLVIKNTLPEKLNDFVKEESKSKHKSSNTHEHFVAIVLMNDKLDEINSWMQYAEDVRGLSKIIAHKFPEKVYDHISAVPADEDRHVLAADINDVDYFLKAIFNIRPADTFFIRLQAYRLGVKDNLPDSYKDDSALSFAERQILDKLPELQNGNRQVLTDLYANEPEHIVLTFQQFPELIEKFDSQDLKQIFKRISVSDLDLVIASYLLDVGTAGFTKVKQLLDDINLHPHDYSGTSLVLACMAGEKGQAEVNQEVSRKLELLNILNQLEPSLKAIRKTRENEKAPEEVPEYIKIYGEHIKSEIEKMFNNQNCQRIGEYTQLIANENRDYAQSVIERLKQWESGINAELAIARIENALGNSEKLKLLLESNRVEKLGYLAEVFLELDDTELTKQFILKEIDDDSIDTFINFLLKIRKTDPHFIEQVYNRHSNTLADSGRILLGYISGQVELDSLLNESIWEPIVARVVAKINPAQALKIYEKKKLSQDKSEAAAWSLACADFTQDHFNEADLSKIDQDYLAYHLENFNDDIVLVLLQNRNSNLTFGRRHLPFRRYEFYNERRKKQREKYMPSEVKEQELHKIADRISDEVESLWQQGARPEYVAKALVGVGNKKAMRLREQLIELGYVEAVLIGLINVGTPESMAMREDLLVKFGSKDIKKSIKIWVMNSLAGVVTPEAMKLRKKLLIDGVNGIFALHSLCGVAIPEAMPMRDDLLRAGEPPETVAESLAGVGTPESMRMRETLLRDASLESVAVGLAGVGTPEAMDLRRRILTHTDYFNGDICLGLAGVDGPEADKMRKEIITSSQISNYAAGGFAGVKSAASFELRKEIFRQKVNEFAWGFSANRIINAVVTKYGYDGSKSIEQNSAAPDLAMPVVKRKSFEPEKMLSRINNYLNQLSLRREERKKSVKEFFKQGLETSQETIRFFNQAIQKFPQKFLETMAARKDTSLLGKKLAQKLFPSILRERKNWRNYHGYAGFAEAGEKAFPPAPEDYLNPYFSAESEFAGGDPDVENNKEAQQEVMELREPINGRLLVTGAYGKYQGGKWLRLDDVKVEQPPFGQPKEITITLPRVRQSAVLPKTLGSKIIPERAKGLRGEQEVLLETDIKPTGQGIVWDTKGADKVAFSLEMDELSQEMSEVSARVYDDFRSRYVRQNSKDLTEQIADLPEEIDLFLMGIKSYSPKEQVIAIEQFVRELGYYDMKNGEMLNLKQGKSLEERFGIMETRIAELAEVSPEQAKRLEGKKYAGVCADFAVLTAAILRRAGFVSGVLSGFMPEGTKVEVQHAHGTAFVLWPGKRGGAEIFSVDGTPGGVAGISGLSIAEREAERQMIIGEQTAQAEAKLAEIMKALEGMDENYIKNLTNGELESVLNTVLKYDVEVENVRTLENVLNAYWYTNLHELDLGQSEGQEKFAEFFAEELKVQKEKLGSEIKNPGSALFAIMENFMKKFRQANKVDSVEGAANLTNVIFDSVKNQLTPTECRAAAGITTYLKAKKIKG